MLHKEISGKDVRYHIVPRKWHHAHGAVPHCGTMFMRYNTVISGALLFADFAVYATQT